MFSQTQTDPTLICFNASDGQSSFTVNLPIKGGKMVKTGGTRAWNTEGKNFS